MLLPLPSNGEQSHSRPNALRQLLLLVQRAVRRYSVHRSNLHLVAPSALYLTIRRLEAFSREVEHVPFVVGRPAAEHRRNVEGVLARLRAPRSARDDRRVRVLQQGRRAGRTAQPSASLDGWTEDVASMPSHVYKTETP